MVESPETPHQHHHSTGLPWFDFIVPIAVLCISVASLLTSLQSEKSMHALVEQNERLVSAQSTPLLMLDSGNNEAGKPVLTMDLLNVGTGPAQISWLHLTDSEGHDASGDALTGKILALDPNAVITSERVQATVIRAGTQRNIFSWPRPKAESRALPEWNKLNETRFRLQASACYCSIFDECKITHFGDSHPQPVTTCDAAEK